MRAVWDLESWQPSYSFLNFLVGAEMERIKHGDQYLDLVINPSTNGYYNKYKFWPRTVEEADQCMDMIVKPMISMLPSVRNVEWPRVRRIIMPTDYYLPRFTTAPFTAAYALGIRPLHWSPMEGVVDTAKLVTMTWRECGSEHWEARDTDVNAWTNAAHKLQSFGYDVRIVRDTRKANEKLPDLNTMPVASRYLHQRASLYMAAACNLFVSNGPAWFALALDAPVIMFRPSCNEAAPSASDDYLGYVGIRRGEQLAGAVPHQRLVWDDDTADNIVRECKRFMNARNRISGGGRLVGTAG